MSGLLLHAVNSDVAIVGDTRRVKRECHPSRIYR
jgi:hypothetical protein